MRIFGIATIFFIFTIVFLTFNASSEVHRFDNLTVAEEEVRIFTDDQIWLRGDILIDGELTFENCSLNVNRTLDLTTSEIRVKPGGQLNLFNTTISTMEFDSNSGIANESIVSPYTLVLNESSLSIYNSRIYYGMIWLVGGDAEITGLVLDGFNMVNYGIFSEDTNLKASSVSIRNYTQGLRSIGETPDLESIFYYNCSTQMTQEWWITFSPFDNSTGLPISGFEVRQWEGERMIGTWNWAKEYEIDSFGQKIDHTTKLSFYINLYFGYIDVPWEGRIFENTDLIQNFNLNHTQISLDSPIIFTDDEILEKGQKAPKWSNVNFSVIVNNPTDINFYNLNLNLLINGNSGYSTTVVLLNSNDSQRVNVSWKATVEGPMSFGVQAVVVDYSGNLSDYKISVYRFLQVESDSDINAKSSGSWTALLAIFTLMSLCSYIIYTGMEEEVITSDSDDNSISEESISEDEDLREMAISEETDDEKDLE
jgi:hypothetical protein|tara:strand:- start:18400 stop:19842 length:1443 start_codon:yes stop_codon:yes gene_type:complete